MTKFEHWIVSRIIRKEVRQGNHRENITNLYRMIRVAAEQEFYEDNLVSQNCYLRDWHDDSLRKTTQ